MDPFKGILVQVISNGQLLESYDDPDASDNENPYQRQQYIEAVTGATFSVKVTITDQFDFCQISRQDGVAVELGVDGFCWSHGRYCRREDLEYLFRRGGTWTHAFDKFTHFSDKTGRWMESEYSFNALKLNESTGVDLLPAQVQHLGNIQIRVRRAASRRCESLRAAMIPVKTIAEVSETALKGKAVENSVKPTEGVPADAPKHHDVVALEPIPGSEGIPLVHKLLYRSKRHLQMIGCIPPEPSSPAIITLNDEEQDSASRAISINANSVDPHDLQQQVQTLRAQLALLERTLNVKSEPQNTNVQATSQHPGNIKREREEDEDAAPRQRRRIAAKIETIDLIDD